MNNENIENIENIVFSSGDPYSSFLDKPVEIISMGQTRIGIYKGITESDDLVLYPSLSIEKSQDEKKIFWNIIHEQCFSFKYWSNKNGLYK